MAIGTSLLTLLVTSIAGYLALIVYRIFLSPLAPVPGPKLAAATYLYEAYYDLYKDGQLMFKIQELHKQYDRKGPIIRISPREIHIHDPDFVNNIYVSRYDKDEKFLLSLGQDTLSVSSAVDHATHAARRNALNPFFSRSAIFNRIDTIQNTIQNLCRRLSQACKAGQVVPLDAAFTAVSLDVITLFAWGTSYNHMDKPDFATGWQVMLREVFKSPALVRVFPLMHYIQKIIPPSMVKKLNPLLAGIIDLQQDARRQIQHILKTFVPPTDPDSGYPPKNVFEQILMSKLPPEEKQEHRLVPEGLLLLAAGSDTTAKSMTVTAYHLLKNPEILNRLREELRSAMPDVNSTPTWNQLEQLPLLTGVIKEGARLAGGLTARMPRIAREDVQYGRFTIPAGYPMAQTPYLLLRDPGSFPEPDVFRPERWLVKDETTGQLVLNKPLNDKMVAWSKGPRNCLGISLAYAELYMVIAYTFRRFEIDLAETTDEDIFTAHDYFLPYPKASSKGLRVLITKDVFANS